MQAGEQDNVGCSCARCDASPNWEKAVNDMRSSLPDFVENVVRESE